MATSSTSFKPGASGNPGGRPKVVGRVQRLARKHTKAALKTLADVMGDDKAPPAARVAAANAILDRGYGKPMQSEFLERLDRVEQLLSGRNGGGKWN